MKREFNLSRTFGVEIEMVVDQTNGPTFASDEGIKKMIAEILKDEGINAEAQGYNHNDSASTWKVITDSSCGFEVVSPILMGERGLEQVRTVAKALSNVSWLKVNKDCGLHVHHGVDDYKFENFKNLFISYVKFENVFDMLMPESRRGDVNSYCKSLKNISQNNAKAAIDEIDKCKDFYALENLFYTRYIKLNLQSYMRHGTIEFRQHSGTLNADKMINWIVLTQLMVETAVDSNVKRTYKTKYESWNGLKRLIGAEAKEGLVKEMNTFYRKRIRELHGKGFDLWEPAVNVLHINNSYSQLTYAC